MHNVEYELRKLMNSYLEKYQDLEKEMGKAKRKDDYDAEERIELLQRQSRKMTAELFKTMKSLNVLTEEELKYGGINKFKQ